MDRWLISKGLMSLAMLCQAAPVGLAADSLNGSWKAVAIGAAAVAGPTLVVEGAKVSGMGGCNRYSGPVTVDGNSVRFGPLVSTRMACEQLAVEQSFFDALEGVRTFAAEGERLKLIGEDGSALVTLRK